LAYSESANPVNPDLVNECGTSGSFRQQLSQIDFGSTPHKTHRAGKNKFAKPSRTLTAKVLQKINFRFCRDEICE
jgi:hypothetical protein